MAPRPACQPPSGGLWSNRYTLLQLPELPGRPDTPALDQALAALWEKFKPSILERLDRLDETSAALASGSLDEERRRAAERDVHKLAGSLGSFGFGEGSRLARSAEVLLQSTQLSQAELAARLRQILAQLRPELDQPPRLPSFTLTPAAATEGPSVLVVGDDPELARRLLVEAASQPFRTQHVGSPSAARARIEESVPDAVLLDLGWDGETAHEALGLVSELSARTPPVPVLVLSPRTSLLDRVEVARRGAAVYLQKPVIPEQVSQALGQVLKRESTVEERILAVDDDPLVLETLETLLAPFEYRLTTLQDPLKFWDVLEESLPDLVLLDLDMPTLSGIELCRVVRTDPRWAGLPVLFLTVHTDPELIQGIFTAGADDYVAKPIVGPELLTRMANRLERTRLHRRLAETDVLTGLANRQKATQALGQLLRLSDRHAKPVSLAVVDLDHFKEINDRFGHTAGDGVLRRVGDLLGRAFRRDDVVGRWGGEEFIVGLFGMSGAAGEQRLAYLLESLREERFSAPNGERYSVSFSAGIAEYPRDGTDLGTLFRAADEALYRAKAAGRARVLGVRS